MDSNRSISHSSLKEWQQYFSYYRNIIKLRSCLINWISCCLTESLRFARIFLSEAGSWTRCSELISEESLETLLIFSDPKTCSRLLSRQASVYWRLPWRRSWSGWIERSGQRNGIFSCHQIVGSLICRNDLLHNMHNINLNSWWQDKRWAPSGSWDVPFVLP